MTEEVFFHTLKEVPLATIVKEEYRNYQIYTLMDRAIPYLQDGLKPGQRRILYTLYKNQHKGLLKVTAATGMILTLHPHGPSSIESAIINLAQDFTFSNNYPLIDKKGYFGERMETSAAAGRYIECKLGKIAKILLFDDLDQVKMVPNFDEKTLEPVSLLPKLPIMLLNGAEGIGTGFSSVIPSFHHKDLVDSIISIIKTGKPIKLKSYVMNFSNKIKIDKKNKIIFEAKFAKIRDAIFITELPRGYDAIKTYRYLSKFIENDFIKDFIDSTVNNNVKIQLIFKKGCTPSLKKVISEMYFSSSITPNYTLISERGVRLFDTPEEIIEIFTYERLKIIKRRYELLIIDREKKIRLNDEIIRFIKNKEYEVAVTSHNKKIFLTYLQKNKYLYFESLAEMPIYKMTKDEVEKRKLLIMTHQRDLEKFKKIVNSEDMIKEQLIEELLDVKEQLNLWLKEYNKKL